MKTAGSHRLNERLMLVSQTVSEEGLQSGKAQILSCGGVYLRRGALSDTMRNWRVAVHLPHEEGIRLYQINRQTTESVFHLILRRQSLN